MKRSSEGGEGSRKIWNEVERRREVRGGRKSGERENERKE